MRVVVHIFANNDRIKPAPTDASREANPMLKKLGAYEIVTGGLTIVIGILLAVMTDKVFDQGATLGEHTGNFGAINQRFDQLDQSLKDMEARLGVRFDGVEKKVAEVQTAVDMRTINLKEMVAQMGVVGPEANFQAIVFDGSLWALPTDTGVQAAFEKQGLKKEAINPSLGGYRLRPIDYDSRIFRGGSDHRIFRGEPGDEKQIRQLLEQGKIDGFVIAPEVAPKQ